MDQRPRKRRSRPCSVCRRWFVPDPRVGWRQKTCGAESCRKEQKRRRQADWSKRNADYWTERRLREQAERVKKGRGASVIRPPPRELGRLPIDFAQAAIGAQGLVIVSFCARIGYQAAQAAIAAQVGEIKKDLAGIKARGRQAAILEIGPDG